MRVVFQHAAFRGVGVRQPCVWLTSSLRAISFSPSRSRMQHISCASASEQRLRRPLRRLMVTHATQAHRGLPNSARSTSGSRASGTPAASPPPPFLRTQRGRGYRFPRTPHPAETTKPPQLRGPWGRVRKAGRQALSFLGTDFASCVSKNISDALTTCREPFATDHSPLSTHHSPLITHHSPLITHHSSLITRHSSLITHRSLLITHHSSLIAHYSSLITHHSSLITPHSSLITQHSTLTTHHSSRTTSH